MNWFNKLLVFLLILLLTHAPLPWAHTHSNLTEQELVNHLRVFHSATDHSELPVSWHWHVFVPDLNCDNSDGMFASTLLEKTERSAVSRKDEYLTAVFEDSACQPGWAMSSRYCAFDQTTYLRLGRMLI